MEFSICKGGGGFGELLTFEAILDTFIISPCDTPPSPNLIWIFFYIFGHLREKMKMS